MENQPLSSVKPTFICESQMKNDRSVNLGKPTSYLKRPCREARIKTVASKNMRGILTLILGKELELRFAQAQ
jgi:hypothetical protein